VVSKAQARAYSPKAADFEKMEFFLRAAPVVSIEKDATGGRTAPWIIGLDDGKAAMRAFFKYIHRPRPALLPTSYKYEIAAFELSKIVGLEIVPPVVEREIEDRPGSLQIFIDGCLTETERRRKRIEPPDPEAFARALENINVFENLTFAARSDPKDVLIHEDDWTVCRVDFSEAFEPSPKLIPGQDIRRCSSKLYENLTKADPGVVKNRLAPYLNEEEIRSLLERKRLILDRIAGLIREKGEESVLFGETGRKK